MANRAAGPVGAQPSRGATHAGMRTRLRASRETMNPPMATTGMAAAKNQRNGAALSTRPTQATTPRVRQSLSEPQSALTAGSPMATGPTRRQRMTRRAITTPSPIGSGRGMAPRQAGGRAGGRAGEFVPMDAATVKTTAAATSTPATWPTQRATRPGTSSRSAGIRRINSPEAGTAATARAAARPACPACATRPRPGHGATATTRRQNPCANARTAATRTDATCTPGPHGARGAQAPSCPATRRYATPAQTTMPSMPRAAASQAPACTLGCDTKKPMDAMRNATPPARQLRQAPLAPLTMARSCKHSRQRTRRRNASQAQAQRASTTRAPNDQNEALSHGLLT